MQFSWDFDECLIYIFEIRDAQNQGNETVVRTPFSEEYRLNHRICESVQYLLDDISKYVTEGELTLVFYPFTGSPKEICKFSEIRDGFSLKRHIIGA